MCKDFGWVSRNVPVGHSDFGQAVSCVCRSESSGADERRRRYANLPNAGEPRTFANFTPVLGAEAAYEAAKNFAAGEGGNAFLVIWGQNGNGKSHLVEAIGRDMLDQDYIVKYLFAPRWLAELRATFDTGAEESLERLFSSYESADVVLLDDLGREKPSEWTREQVTKLLAPRYADNRLMVITTNDDELRTAEKQGPAIADRLFDFGSGIVQPEHNSAISYRTAREWGDEDATRNH